MAKGKLSFLLKEILSCSIFLHRHQAGWFPFRQEGGQQQAANNVEGNRDGQNANNPDLEEMVSRSIRTLQYNT